MTVVRTGLRTTREHPAIAACPRISPEDTPPPEPAERTAACASSFFFVGSRGRSARALRLDTVRLPRHLARRPVVFVGESPLREMALGPMAIDRRDRIEPYLLRPTRGCDSTSNTPTPVLYTWTTNKNTRTVAAMLPLAPRPVQPERQGRPAVLRSCRAGCRSRGGRGLGLGEGGRRQSPRGRIPRRGRIVVSLFPVAEVTLFAGQHRRQLAIPAYFRRTSEVADIYRQRNIRNSYASL